MASRIRRRPLGPLPSLALPALLHRLYAARQVGCEQELRHQLDALPPADFQGMDAAVALLVTAISEQQSILIVADYDADGATSCALAVRGLRAFGAAQVAFLVPNRFDYGYGLSPEIVAVAAEQRPDLLVTVDNGIASISGVAAAKAAGMRVLVTDHHLPGETLPAADAIVNPNLPGDPFPSKALAGVGVMFYVLVALRAALEATGWFDRTGRQRPVMGQFLDLVALGTVADVVALDHTNRILVEQGLRRIRAGRCVPGIDALAQVAGRRRQNLCASDLGFFLGPRLNAAGRLDDMSLGIQCLLSDDSGSAQTMAQELDALNRERRSIGAVMEEQAWQQLEQELVDLDPPHGLCLYDERWHQGVIGILASRVKDRLYRPVIAFAPDRDGLIKGSARSIAGLHLRDALAAVAQRCPGVIKFGGHAAAAGLTLVADSFHDFQQAFDEEVRRHLGPEELRQYLLTDGELQPEELSLDTAELLHQAGPWGQGFPEPLFDGLFEVLTIKAMGEGHKHHRLQLRPPGSRATVEGVAFNSAQRGLHWPRDPQVLRLAYRLAVNDFRGRRNAQLIVEHLEVP